MHLGWPATSVAIMGLLFVAGSLVSLLRVRRSQPGELRDAAFLVGLVAVFALQLLYGIRLIRHKEAFGPLQDLSVLVIVCFLIGIARSWELIGGPSLSIVQPAGRVTSTRRGRDAPVEQRHRRLIPASRGYGSPSLADRVKEETTMATVLQDATVFTGLDDGVISGGTVVIEDGLIASIDDGTPREYGPDATVVDCSGKTITPGIIDAHAHLVYHELTNTYDIDLGKSLEQATLEAVANAEKLLRLGITTIRDPGTRANIAVLMRDAIRDGDRARPSRAGVEADHLGPGRTG